MEQPQVLKHSHSPFKKRDDPHDVECLTSEHDPSNVRPPVIEKHQADTSNQPSVSPKHEEIESSDENETSSDDEEISASVLGEELENAEMDPCFGHSESQRP